MQYTENLGKQFQRTPVVFHNVTLKRALILQENRATQLSSTLHGGSGKFEFYSDGDMVVNGTINCYAGDQGGYPTPERSQSEFLPLNTDDVYKEFRLRGYNYSGPFQGIQRIDNEGTSCCQFTSLLQHTLFELFCALRKIFKWAINAIIL